MDTNKKVWPRSYVPSPKIPKWFQRDLERKAGTNLFGEPNYRVVWGMDARDFVNGDPNAIKYMNPNDDKLGWACFMLERFATPGFFGSPEEWEKFRYGPCVNGTMNIIDHLGPFPSRGTYILAAPLMNEDYEPLPLTSAILDEIVSRIGHGSQTSNVLGQLELQRRVKKAQTSARVAELLGQQFEYYRTHGERINRLASRHTVGPSLTTVSPSVLQKTSDLFINKGTEPCQPQNLQ